jgi:hypothetical protein
MRGVLVRVLLNQDSAKFEHHINRACVIAMSQN